MAQQVPNLFTQYSWDSPEEESMGNVLNSSNIIAIQNRLSLAATERAQLEYDVNNPHATLQREAALKGEMDAYQFLLDAHHNTINATMGNMPDSDTF